MAKETIQSVERTFQIIELLAERGAMGVREIGHETGLHSTVVHRVLGTLVDMGYAGQESETGKYLLTYKMLAVGNSIPVSYTHLDVYKRQEKMFLTGPWWK